MTLSLVSCKMTMTEYVSKLPQINKNSDVSCHTIPYSATDMDLLSSCSLLVSVCGTF